MMTKTWDQVGIDVSKVVGGKTFCPKCGPTRKNKFDRSLSVNVAEGWWKCHNHPCDFHGRLDSSGYVPVVKSYKTPDPRTGAIPEEVYAWFEQQRHISRTTVDRLGTTFSTEWMPQTQADTQVLCFNYVVNGELINIKFRGPNKEFRMVGGCKLVFFNMDACNGYDEVIIVEGEIDVYAFAEAGIYNVISVPNGATLPGENGEVRMNLEYLDNCWEFFESKKSVIICTDNDRAGEALQNELARRIGYEKCKRVAYPESVKDTNDVLIKHGRVGVVDLYSSARPFPVKGVIGLEDVYEDVVSLFERGRPPGLRIGMGGLDEFCSFNQETGELWMITGIPSHGKSEVLTDICSKMTVGHGFKWGWFSFETDSVTNVTLLSEKIGGKAFSHRKNPDDRLSREDLDRSLMFIDNHYWFYENDDDMSYTVDTILETCRQLVLRYGVNGIVIDPWNYLESQLEKGETETMGINRTLSRIKLFTKKYGVHIFLVAHPTKMKKYDSGDKRGFYIVPTLYDISGSAHFYNKTDNGLCVYRNFATGTTEIHVQKWKRYWLGGLGVCEFGFDTQRRQYIPNNSL